MINVDNLTMLYPSKKGIFDINFTVKEGEAIGYLGPNGAGKTTTIRALMGFMKPDIGTARINNLDCTKDSPKIMNSLGYIPGEITFLEGMTGDEYLLFLHNLRGSKSKTLQNKLLDMFELSPKGKIKKYSKGMKQKLGIVAAFMHDPKVLILDEPTSGLDPLMQNTFIELILSERKKGKTILMSSHIFEEVEKTCDNVLIIKEGRIVAKSDINTLKESKRKAFKVQTTDNTLLYNELQNAKIESDFIKESNLTKEFLEIYSTSKDIDTLIKLLSKHKILSFDAKEQTLDEVFMKFYKV